MIAWIRGLRAKLRDQVGVWLDKNADALIAARLRRGSAPRLSIGLTAADIGLTAADVSRLRAEHREDRHEAIAHYASDVHDGKLCCAGCEADKPVADVFRCYFCLRYYCDNCGAEHFGAEARIVEDAEDGDHCFMLYGRGDCTDGVAVDLEDRE